MSLCVSGKPVMIITEYMENGSLDTFLKVRWLQEVGKRLPGNLIFFSFFCGSQLVEFRDSTCFSPQVTTKMC